MFNPRPLYCSSFTTTIGGIYDTNFVDSGSPYCGTNHTLNKRIDGLETSLNQKIDNLQYSVTRITNFLEVHEKGRFPSQTLPNPKGVHDIGSSSNSRMDEVKAIVTLRSRKEIEQQVPMTAEETEKENEVEPERIVIREDSMKKNMPPPFPQELRSKKKNHKPS